MGLDETRYHYHKTARFHKLSSACSAMPGIMKPVEESAS
jgi:hypothetical protein